MTDEQTESPSTGELMIPDTGLTGVAERPKSINPNDRSGTENIGVDELRLPRLSISHPQSPEMTEGDSKFIAALKPYEMFNNMIGDVYGRGPLMFIPLRRDVKRIEFIPRTEGGGIRDMDVPKNDVRLKWTGVGVDRKPPVATEFIEFPSLLLRSGKAPEPILVSIKTTNKWNRRAADQLTLFIKMRNAPVYAGLYTIESKPEKNDKGQFGVPVIKNAGFIPKDSEMGAKLYAFAEQLSKNWEGKEVVTNREAPGADDFDAEHLERESQRAAGTTDM